MGVAMVPEAKVGDCDHMTRSQIHTTIQDTIHMAVFLTLRTCHVFMCGVCVCWSILGGLSGSW